MKLKGLYLWPFLESFSRYSSFVSCCLLVTKSATMKPLPVLWDGSWIFSPFTLRSTAMRPCVDRANQEPPSLPGSRSRPLLQEHIYFAYYMHAVHILQNNLCQFRSQCMGLSESMLFCHTLTDCFTIKTFSNTLLFTFYVLIKLLHDAICSVLSEFAAGFVAGYCTLYNKQCTLWQNTIL